MILETKLQLPQPKAGTLLRSGLLELLKNNLDKKLVLITAGAGYGKTTLLVQLVKEARLPFMFYDLDKNDSDLMVFYAYLVNGLKQIDPALVKYAEQLLKSATADGWAGKNIELLFGTLINELYEKRKEELFIILDNYHNIAEDSVVHRALDFFIDRMPDKIHVVISSRSVPPLPSLARWRAKQDMFEISREDLEFTLDSIVALLRDVYKTALPEEDVRRLAARTEGWITGIQMILRSAGKDKTAVRESLKRQAEDNQPLFEYFASEILSMESPEMRDFLIGSSILSIITPAACDAILGRKNSKQALINLERRRLFVSAFSDGSYKYHHLFRLFLQERLKEGRMPLHRKAAAFYQRQGDAEQAIEHCLEAKDYAKAGELICRIAGDMTDKARFTVIENWLRRMPEQAFDKQPELHITASIFHSAQGRFDEALAQCDKAMPLLKRKGDFKAIAQVLKGQACIAGIKNDHNRALTISRQAMAIIGRRKIPKEERIKLTGTLLNIMAISWSEMGKYNKAVSCMLRARRMTEYHFIDESNLAQIYTYMGKEQEACDIYRDLFIRIKGVYFHRIGAVYHNAVISALYCGDTEWAEQAAEQGWEACRYYDDAWSKAHLQYCFGIINLQKGRWEDARSRFNQAAKLASGLNLIGLEFAAQRDTIRTYRYQGDYAAAREQLDRLLPSIGEKSSRSLANLRIEQSLLESALGEHTKAEKAAKYCLRQARRSGWNLMAFLSQMALARIAAEQRKDKQAAAWLHQAVSYSTRHRCGGLLARELRASPELLKLAKNLQADSDYLGRILAEYEKYCPTPDEPSLTVQLLGGFELAQGGGGRKILLKRKTTRAILAFFLLHPNKGFSWEEIAAWAWPESSAKASHQMFKIALWEIHKCSPVFKSAIKYLDHHYTCILKPDSSIQIDAREFQDTLKKIPAANEETGKTSLLEKAVSAYRGPLLPEFYFTWTDDLRNSLEGKYLDALCLLAKKYHAGQDYDKSSAVCQKYLETDGLDEEIHRLLIDSYIQLGQKSKAVKQLAHLKKSFANPLKPRSRLK